MKTNKAIDERVKGENLVDRVFHWTQESKS